MTSKKQAKRLIKQLLAGADVTDKAKKQFKIIWRQLGELEFYFAPNIVNGELDGWNLMRHGLHWSFLTDALTFEKLQFIAWNMQRIERTVKEAVSKTNK